MSEIKRKAVFLYDYTGIMAQPWLEAGYECWLFDGQHKHGITREGLLVKVGVWFDAKKIEEHAQEILDMVGHEVLFVFGFPECTHMAVSGARHFKSKLEKDPLIQIKAANLAILVKLVGEKFKCKWGAENPISVLSSLWRKPDFMFDPCDYAGYLPPDDSHPLHPAVYPPQDRYNKKTCIWCGSGFIEPEKKRIAPEFKDNPGWSRTGGRSMKTKNIRSATPRGFARAVFLANS